MAPKHEAKQLTHPLQILTGMHCKFLTSSLSLVVSSAQAKCEDAATQTLQIMSDREIQTESKKKNKKNKRKTERSSIEAATALTDSCTQTEASVALTDQSMATENDWPPTVRRPATDRQLVAAKHGSLLWQTPRQIPPLGLAIFLLQSHPESI